MHEVAGAKARGEQRAREPPVVGRAPLGLVDRSGRSEHAPHLAPARGREAAERPLGLLQFQELRLADHRQLRERGARGDRGRVDAGEEPRERRRARPGVGDLPRQLRQQRPLALLGIAGLERVEVIGHRSSFRSVRWRGQDRGLVPARELGEDQRMRALEQRLDLRRPECSAGIELHPMGAREVGRRNDSRLVGEFEEAIGVALEGEPGRVAAGRREHREHPSADRPHLVVAPLDVARGAGKRGAVAAEAVEVHRRSGSESGRRVAHGGAPAGRNRPPRPASACGAGSA